MKEVRLKYTAFLLEKYDHKGRVVQIIQEKCNVSRRTAYYDINKVCKKSEETDK